MIYTTCSLSHFFLSLLILIFRRGPARPLTISVRCSLYLFYFLHHTNCLKCNSLYSNFPCHYLLVISAETHVHDFICKKYRLTLNFRMEVCKFLWLSPPCCIFSRGHVSIVYLHVGVIKPFLLRGRVLFFWFLKEIPQLANQFALKTKHCNQK